MIVAQIQSASFDMHFACLLIMLLSMLSRRESFIKLRDCGSDQDIKLLAKETKSLGVMVNADDAALRANRLALLASLHDAMNRVADLSKLAS